MRRRESVLGVVVEHRDGGLANDGAGVETFVDEVHGASGDLDAVRERGGLRVQSRERTAAATDGCSGCAGGIADETGTEDAHVAGQADQVDPISFELGCDLLVVDLAIEAFRGENDCVQSALTGDIDPGRVGAIGNHDGDLGVEFRLAAIASAMATKFEPRPESRMPRRLLIRNRPASRDCAPMGYHGSFRLQDFCGGVQVALGDHEDHADARG